MLKEILTSNKKIEKILYCYITFVIIAVTFLFFQSIRSAAISPVHIDETSVYSTAKLFYETNSVKSAFSVYEQRSAIGEFNWYGPGYHVIYGGLSKIVGFSNVNFIWFNYFFFLGAVFTAFLFNIDKLKRLLFVTIFLSSYASFSFVFTYFPEMLQILLAMILLAVFSWIKDKPKIIYVYIGLIVLFALVRSTSIFWIFSLLFLRDSILNFKVRAVIVFVCFSLILLSIKYLTAPAFNAGLKELHSGKEHLDLISIIVNILKNGLKNIYMIFDIGNSAILYLLLLLGISFYNLSLNFKETIKNNLEYVGLFFVCFLIFFTLLFLYTTKPFFFEKQSMFLIPILIFLIVNTKYNVRLLLLFSCFIFLPISYAKARYHMIERREFHGYLQDYTKMSYAFSTIFNEMDFHGKEKNVMFLYNEYVFPNNMVMAFLQSSNKGVPILYTTNVIDDLTDADKVKFKMHHRLKIDYILSRNKLKIPNLTCVKTTDYYYLYQVNN